MSRFCLAGAAEQACGAVDSLLRRTARHATERGLGVPEISGKLLRPIVAWALLPEAHRRPEDPVFGAGALAIQMVHEASLLHDDVLDGAASRRGMPTVQARKGIGAALVMGDRYLTSAYVVAGDTRSPTFVAAFARAVERTVAGEMKQGASRGRILSDDTYESIIRGKSGELFGAAAVLASEVGGRPVPVELGLRIGALYQRIDDLLDYCVELEQDKPPLQDWRQRKWTFPLGFARITEWELSETEVQAALRAEPAPALLAALRSVEALADGIAADAAALLTDSSLLQAILASWCAAARRGIELELGGRDSVGARRSMSRVS